MPRRNATPDEMRQYILDNSEPVTESGCWIWMGTIGKQGYGSMRVGGRMKKTHRVSYDQFVGPIPPGMCICHSCDVPSCCNPSHLWAGTNQENIDDRERKGRNVNHIGEDHGMAKLTEENILFIRDRYSNGVESQRQLARRFSMSKTQIGRIVRNESWVHLNEVG